MNENSNDVVLLVFVDHLISTLNEKVKTLGETEERRLVDTNGEWYSEDERDDIITLIFSDYAILLKKMLRINRSFRYKVSQSLIWNIISCFDLSYKSESQGIFTYMDGFVTFKILRKRSKILQVSKDYVRAIYQIDCLTHTPDKTLKYEMKVKNKNFGSKIKVTTTGTNENNGGISINCTTKSMKINGSRGDWTLCLDTNVFGKFICPYHKKASVSCTIFLRMAKCNPKKRKRE